MTLTIGANGLATRILRTTVQGCLTTQRGKANGTRRNRRDLQRLGGSNSTLSGVRVASTGVNLFGPYTGGCSVSFALQGSHAARPPQCVIVFGSGRISGLRRTFGRFATGGLGRRRHPSVQGALTILGRGTTTEDDRRTGRGVGREKLSQ